MNITNRFYQWSEVWGGSWGSILFKEDGTIGCHNTYNERTWKIEQFEGKDYIIITGDGAEATWIELSDQETMFGNNFEGKVVSLRLYGGEKFRRTIARAFAYPDLTQTIRNLGIIAHNGVVPSSLSKWDEMEYFIGLQQNPVEFADYLRFLADKQIDTYLEIGTFCGGTFIATMEYLKKIGRKPHGVACDVANRENTFAYYNDFGNCEVHNINSASVNFDLLLGERKFDLAFVDGDHNYNGVKNDWEKVKTRARIVTFHDIAYASGVIQLWKEIKAAGYKTQEFIYPGKSLGIGVVIL